MSHTLPVFDDIEGLEIKITTNNQSEPVTHHCWVYVADRIFTAVVNRKVTMGPIHSSNSVLRCIS